jgi:preprotein translocase subunit SecG
MENIILVIHLILALCLIGVVLLQRSEGGGLGIGGGGGGAMSGRSAASALARLTWVFAIGFIVTSISLTVLAARNASGDSVIERLGVAPTETQNAPASTPLGGNLLPPTTEDAPATPPKATE